MKIPKIIRIGWRDYTIKFVNEALRDEKGDLLDAQVDFSNRIICIDNNIVFNDEKIIKCFHEAWHVIFKNQWHSEWCDNEDLVDACAEGMFQLVRDNPGMFK